MSVSLDSHSASPGAARPSGESTAAGDVDTARAASRRPRRRWPLRLLGVAVAVKLAAAVVSGPAVVVIDRLATVGLVVAASAILILWLAGLRRRLLWRVRRKLILSYVFIGFVPVLLVVAFFAVAGAMLVLASSADRVRREVDRVVSDARMVATAIGGRVAGGRVGLAVLAPLAARTEGVYPDASALVAGGRADAPLQGGPWRHASLPVVAPDWLGPEGFAGLVTAGPTSTLVARAVEPAGDTGGWVVVDLPIGPAVRRALERASGVGLGALGDAPAADPALASSEGLAWVAFLTVTDWPSGRAEAHALDIRVPPSAFAERLFGTDTPRGQVNVQFVLVVLLATIGGLFLVIELAAFVMGLALARSITGSVHELFTGTEQVRRGDFRHRIRIRSRDQLGELAESFNAMTTSVEGLLHQAAEKKRLEEELRIARRIQTSLLPRGATSIAGLSISAVCRPAREIGGDYYDFIRLGDQRLGLVVADVSGKGTSAALYMAELKGIMLTLGRSYESPRRLLIEANRILARALDSRSFITMLYAVVDLEAGTLTYARAGHTPLVYATRRDQTVDVTQLLPDGLVLGLEGFERQFDELLEERQIAIRPEDLVVLFTDGITEAMNAEHDLFGEARLTRLVAAHASQSLEVVRTEILRDIETFVGGAEQHDDMTMVLLRVERVGPGAAPAAGQVAAAGSER